MADLEKIIEDTAVELLRIAATELNIDYIKAMQQALEGTEGSRGKSQLENILENVNLACSTSKPMCQDTGIVSFIVEVGDKFPIKSQLKKILVNATRRATIEVPLRPNAVDLFKGNTGDNVGLNGHVPIIYMDLVEGDNLEITAMPKGGGSTNIAAHGMLKPGVGLKGVKHFVIESLAQAGSLGCPPYHVGVGIGAGEDICLTLAKKALLNPFMKRNNDPRIAKVEEELLNSINKLEIGAMGLGEGPTVLDVHIEAAARHPASLPVGVVISCWALRHAKASIDKRGSVEMIH